MDGLDLEQEEVEFLVHGVLRMEYSFIVMIYELQLEEDVELLFMIILLIQIE